jgi:prepilin-type N-terminal cleavage/methylation domain-containing protein
MKTNSKKLTATGSVRQTGFTLVEIAIVLVIIGLLLGGILKGQEMITQAKIKNVINDMTGVAAAMYAYQDRYRALPGDDKNAATRWAGITSAGNGDGVILGVYTVAPTSAAGVTPITGDESVLFWHHLRLAGFVSGTGADQPFNAVNGKMGVQTSAGDGVLANMTAGVLGAPAAPVNPITALILCSANLPDKIAISIDAQTDDGIGTTGTVRGQNQAGVANPAIAAVASAYVETGTNSYVVCKTL